MWNPPIVDATSIPMTIEVLDGRGAADQFMNSMVDQAAIEPLVERPNSGTQSRERFGAPSAIR